MQSFILNLILGLLQTLCLHHFSFLEGMTGVHNVDLSNSFPLVLKILTALFSSVGGRTFSLHLVKNDPRSEFSNLSNWKEEA